MNERRARLGRLGWISGAVLMAASLTACASGSHTVSHPGTIHPGAAAGLSPGAPSRFYETPGPSVAVRDAELSKADSDAYRLPRAVAFADAVAFYDAFMPTGRAYGKLKWCDSTSSTDQGVRTIQRSWRASGTTNFLLVQIIDEGVSRPTGDRRC